MQQPPHLFVQINNKRPDYRVFLSYFFGDDFHDYDSDGDSRPVTSKEWTELYMRSREGLNLEFDIYPHSQEPLILKVSSEEESSVYQIAYFLALETMGQVLDENLKELPIEQLIPKMGSFPLQERLNQAKNSIWRLATEENPYPNLN